MGLLGRAIGLDEETASLYELAAPLHDVGKIARGIGVTGNRRGVVCPLEDPAQRRAFGKIAPFHNHQRVALGIREEGFE